MFWAPLVPGIVFVVYGIALVTNWKGFAGVVAKFGLLPYQRRIGYARASGGMAMLLGAGFIAIAIYYLEH